MKSITFSCIKCNTKIQAPEMSQSVICGVCRTWNNPSQRLSNIKTILKNNNSYKKYNQLEDITISHEKQEPMETTDDIFKNTQEEQEEIQINPMANAVSKIFTVIFIVFSIVVSLSDYLNTPYIMPVAVIIIIIMAIFIFKKAINQKKINSNFKFKQLD